jgi:alanine racemase
MDQAALDVTAVPEASVGDIVTLIGQEGAASARADDLARASGTIAYEVLCAISSRVLRRYV